MPKNEKHGRRHSSTVTIVVLDEGQPSRSRSIRTEDVRVDTYRSSGAGGQHRNKTDSAVRLTHLPTGTVVTATEERSQHQNRAVAWERLRHELSQSLSASQHASTNAQRSSAFEEPRSFTWTGWRDEVTSDTGRNTSMRRALAGRLDPLLR